MRRANGRRTFVVLLVTIQMLAAGAAFAAFTATRSGTQSVTTGTLAAPTGAVAANGLCVNNSHNIVSVTWTATSSLFADGYEIFRATAAGGPYTSIATVNGRTTTLYQDQNTLWATTLFYQVKAKRNLWRSPVSNTASVLTPKKNCT